MTQDVENHKSQILKMQKHLHDLKGKRYRLMNDLELSPRTSRRAKTRALIQLGTLIEHAGLANLFQIEHGSDLQKDEGQFDKAATLLGCLRESCSHAFKQNHKHEEWRKIGREILEENLFLHSRQTGSPLKTREEIIE